MKCPKCGFNSFESNDACPRCAASLKELKQTYGLAPVVFPLIIAGPWQLHLDAVLSACPCRWQRGGEFAFESAAGQHDRQSG